MRLDVDVTGNIDQLARQLGATESHVRKASMRALNKTALWLRSKSVKALSEASAVQQKHIRKRFQIVRARVRHLKAYVTANTREIKAAHLGTMRQTGSGVRVGKHRFDGAFIAKMPSGHRGAYKRKTAARFPIKEMGVPLNGKQITDIAETKTAARFIQLFTHELKWVMR